MEAIVRRIVNEFLFKDSWTWPTYLAFVATAVGTFILSTAISRIAFSLVFGEYTPKLPKPHEVDVEVSTESEADGEDCSAMSSAESSSEASSDSSSEDEDGDEAKDRLELKPIKLRLPSLLDYDASVVREPEHLKTL
ncbi:hypothetical protein LEN26_004868 [Aphanomyces euteiches]|nr:hypothetical protein LEN26_004868 [Aphanomyces euteiches]